MSLSNESAQRLLVRARARQRLLVERDRRRRSRDVERQVLGNLRRIGARRVRLEVAGLGLQPDEALAQVAEIELGDLDLRLEQLEAAIAQVFDVRHGQIGLEQHAIAARDLGLGLARRLRPLARAPR